MSRKVYYDGDWVTVASNSQSFDFTKTPVTPAAGGSPLPNIVTLPIPSAQHQKTPTSGAWTEVIASTSADIDYFVLWIYGAGTATDPCGTLLDIGVGAATSEVAVVENIAIMYNFAASSSPYVEVPVHIPAGSRVSVRWQTSHPAGILSSVSLYYMAYGSTGDPAPSSLATISSVNTATTTGVDLGSASNTFVEVVASTAADYKGVIMTFTSNDSAFGASTITADMGVGPSFGTVMASGFYYVLSGSENVTGYGIGGSNWIKQFIPAGSRIGVRWRVNSGASVDNIQCVLLGLPV